MSRRVTLKDIASDMNISRTTVHRALHGKDGVADSLGQSIRARAEEMGYTANYVASSLKRKTVRLAVVLPRKDGNGRYYHKYFWDAVERFIPEAQSLNAIIEFYPFGEETGEQLTALQALADAKDPVDGLLTMPEKSDEAMRRAVERFGYRNIPVVLIDNDLNGVDRLCCVAPHDQMTGRLGAEILTAITFAPGKILVAGGSPNSESHRHNLAGFSDYIAGYGKRFELLVAPGYEDAARCYGESVKLLKKHKDIVAFYSVTARSTLPLCKAVVDCGLKGLLRGVGSDLYPESARLLEEDVVQALIYKNAFDKGRLGFRILFDKVVKNIDVAEDRVTVPIGVILKNNLRFYREFI